MRQDEGGGIGRTYTGFPPPFDLSPLRGSGRAFLEDEMSVKIELEWFTTEEKAHPDTPETDRHCPKVWCLVDREGMGIVARPWDCVSECWNDEEDDDYECGVEGVNGWAIIPDKMPCPPPSPSSALS